MRNHYLQQSVNTASPARLVTMLCDRLLLAIDRTTWAKVRAYPKNVELQVAAVYTGACQRALHGLCAQVRRR